MKSHIVEAQPSKPSTASFKIFKLAMPPPALLQLRPLLLVVPPAMEAPMQSVLCLWLHRRIHAPLLCRRVKSLSWLAVMMTISHLSVSSTSLMLRSHSILSSYNYLLCTPTTIPPCRFNIATLSSPLDPFISRSSIHTMSDTAGKVRSHR